MCKVCDRVSAARDLCVSHYIFAQMRLKGRPKLHRWEEIDRPDFFNGFPAFEILEKRRKEVLQNKLLQNKPKSIEFRREEITDNSSKALYDFLLRLGDVVSKAYLKKCSSLK